MGPSFPTKISQTGYDRGKAKLGSATTAALKDIPSRVRFLGVLPSAVLCNIKHKYV